IQQVCWNLTRLADGELDQGLGFRRIERRGREGVDLLEEEGQGGGNDHRLRSGRLSKRDRGDRRSRKPRCAPAIPAPSSAVPRRNQRLRDLSWSIGDDR